MAQRLETFAKKHNLELVITKKAEEVEYPPVRNQNGWQKEIKKRVEWEFKLGAPVLARILRVKRWTRNGCSITMVMITKGATRKEARKKLLKVICGGVLIYANSIDRECGDDPEIKVPRDLK